MELLFCHGLESGPHGRKFDALRGAGFDVHAPDCRNQDLATRVITIVELIVGAQRPPLVVGSSFGGMAAVLAVATAHDRGVVVPGLVLCAPALGIRQPPVDEIGLRCPVATVVIHGTRDDVVPIEGSRALARSQGAILTETDDDHSLAQSLPSIIAAVRELAKSSGSSVISSNP